MFFRAKPIVGLCLAIALAATGLRHSDVVLHALQAQNDAALIARARAIHERVLTLDTHNDIEPEHFTASCNYTMRLTTQVNLPKMREGGLDVSFMIAYVGQGPLTPPGYEDAYRQAVAKFDAVHRLTEQIAPKEIGLALSPADVRKIAASGRKVAVIGIENGYPMGLDIRRVKEFYDRGGRYMSLAHNGHSQLADSNTGERDGKWLYGGLSPLGKQVIAELNRLGIMVDVSHPSKGAMMQAVALSKAPVIASHSAARALADVSRNMDDEMLMALKQNGGVIQTVAFSTYIKADPPQRSTALTALRREFALAETTPNRERTSSGCPVEGTTASAAPSRPASPSDAVTALSPERRAEYQRRLTEINTKWPSAPRATVKDFVDHIDYLVKLIGIDHVGISSDFDGGGGIDGWNSAAETFNVTLELVRRGYSEEDIAKLWSGNLLRVWEQVEQVAKGIQAGKM
ncbi:MAG TPA: dipeptidase [Vicinamibacterales bacterium]